MTDTQFHSIRRWIKVGTIALIALVLGSSYKDHRRDVGEWKDDIATCERSNDGRTDAASRDGDLGRFAAQAAKARRDSGDVEVALGYEAIASRSRARAARTLGRKVDCGDEFEEPSLLPF